MPGIVDPTKEVLNKGIFFPLAKIIGGCSTVNGMIYMQVIFFFHAYSNYSIFKVCSNKLVHKLIPYNAKMFIFFRRGHKADYDIWAAQGPEYKIWDYDHCLEGKDYIH